MTDPHLILELTTDCNLDCIYCYNVWKENGCHTSKNLSLSEAGKIVANAANGRAIAGVTLAGGEPLLNPEVFDIASFCASRGIRVSITTNGILLTEDKVVRIAACGVKHIEISMPSTDSGIFRELCGGDELRSVRAAILHVKKHGLKLSVAAVISKMNYHETYELIEMSSALGADHFMLNRFVPGGKGKAHSSLLQPEHQQLLQSLEDANRASAACNIPVIIAIPVQHCEFKTKAFKNLSFGICGCGKHKWVVDPFGRLRLCEQSPEILGDLLTEDFGTLIASARAEEFRTDNSNENCTENKCYAICGGGCRFCR